MYSTIYVELAALDKIARQAEESLRNAPSGSLSVCKSHGFTQFRQRISRDDIRYISTSQKEIIRALAQKDYDKKVLASARREILRLSQFLKAGYLNAPDASENQHHARNCAFVLTESHERPLRREPQASLLAIKSIYDSLLPERKKLVSPYVIPDDQVVSMWEKELGKPFQLSIGERECDTESGIRVRSKSEIIIADKLTRNGIPFRYEQPLRLGTDRNRSPLVYPDFLVLNVRTGQEQVWEHFGLMGEDSYRDNAFMKLARYADCGLLPGSGLIATFETSTRPLHTRTVDALIAQLL